MIFIVVKYNVKPEFAEEFPSHVAEFTKNTRAESGNKFFEWSRDLEDPNQYVLVEAFEDDAAEAHVNSEHFAKGLEAMRPLLAETPRIVSQSLPDMDGWDEMGELVID